MTETEQIEQQQVPAYFPVTFDVREKQAKAIAFIQRAIDKGYRDIVVEAPTGIGKSLIGATACFWGAHSPLSVALNGQPGGYYLVTQKLLQDQLEEDFEHFKPDYAVNACLLKSSVEYDCPQFENCAVGRRMFDSGKVPKCNLYREKMCRYSIARMKFLRGHMSVTNYPFFFTERTFVGQLPAKKVLIADECHSLERQILGFIEIVVTVEQLKEWAPSVTMPEMDCMFAFCDWMNDEYLPIVTELHEAKAELLEGNPWDRRLQVEVQKLETQIGRITGAINSMAADPRNWVYWQDYDEYKQLTQSVAKPLNAAPYLPNLIEKMAGLRIYMSAYPGPKDIFCSTLGLDIEKVAWISLASTFPKENRPVVLLLVGSMGQKSIRDTMPVMLKYCERILEKHKDEKGIIHCHSYKIGNQIFDHLRHTVHADRVLFARNADDRKVAFEQHTSTDEPTVMLSPSMTEGFNLKDNLARFQIIAKMPYPYLGDPQVEAKKNADNDWYVLQTIQTVLQACGRIVRSEKDFGATYVLDADFERLYDNHRKFFPRWFTDGFVWPPNHPNNPKR